MSPKPNTIPLSVNVGFDNTQYPPNWMYVWAMATNAIEWAIGVVQTPEWQQQVKDWYKEKARYETKKEIMRLEKQAKALLNRAKTLREDLRNN